MIKLISMNSELVPNNKKNNKLDTRTITKPIRQVDLLIRGFDYSRTRKQEKNVNNEGKNMVLA